MMINIIIFKNYSINNIKMVFVYARSENGKRIVLLDSTRAWLRCRQRNRNIDNSKVNPMRFASYKETLKSMKRNNTKVVGPYVFYSMSRL